MFAVTIDSYNDTKTVLEQSTPANPIPDERDGKFTLVLSF